MTKRMNNNFESIGSWLKSHNRNDILDRWDYDKNEVSPFKVSKTDKNRYYFKCPKGLHKSELFHINRFHGGYSKNLCCRKCNSLAQGLIDLYGKETFEKMWSDKNLVDPWSVGFQSKLKFIWNCVDNSEHEYEMSADAKSSGQKCPYCSNRRLDKEKSLGVAFPEIFDIWSIKNTNTPYDFSPVSGKEVWWKCENNIHSDYCRKISVSKNCNYACPKCKIDAMKLKKFRIDLTGRHFGELTVLNYDENSVKGKGSRWICKCSCGSVKSIFGSSLTSGITKTCGDRSIHYTDENNSNWKGGKTPLLIKSRMSLDYEKWRQSVFKKDWFTCQCCGAYGSSINKNAHHILNFSEYDDLKYDIFNGITLCEQCHHIKYKNSFHNIYGTKNNTPEQLEEYINNKRMQLGISLPFSIEEYKSGVNLLKPSNKNNVI